MAKQAKPEQLIERAIESLPSHAQGLLAQSITTGSKPVVFVGMSGGVDSSVSAYILQRAGFDVRGYFIKVWQPDDVVCTWKDDRRDAMRVCAQLGIPFETVYAEDAYKQKVADYMIHEYSVGRTPNPDIMCNKYVKFGVYYDFAIASGAHFVATGHYAKTRIRKQSSHAELLQARDENKDQTYFLWAMKGENVSRVLFPVGDLLKEEVRIIAEYIHLPVSDKKDSQGVCFIGKIDMKDFIKQYVPVSIGDVLNTKGEIIGSHSGSILYTIGERHGFDLFHQTPDTKPSFVIKKDIVKNLIYVGLQEELMQAERADIAYLEDINFISKESGNNKKLKARIRHRQKLQNVSVEPYILEKTSGTGAAQDGQIGIVVKFKEPQSGVAPGQSCVLYDGEVCLGGGIIS